MSDSQRFLLDENIPKSVGEFLKSRRFNAEYGPKGITNSELIALARNRETTLITRDEDFLNTSLYPPKEHKGIIVPVAHPPKADKLITLLERAINTINDYKEKTIVISESGIKIIKE